MWKVVSGLGLAGLTGGFLLAACASGAADGEFVDGRLDAGTDIDPTIPLGDQLGEDCRGNLRCMQKDCGQHPPTTVSGTVFAPNGTLPLYNVIVYVPQEPLAPQADNLTCDRCGVVDGKPLVSAITDANGHFQLKNVPVGADIPLVMQIGKWRRQVKIPNVAACQDTPITDPNVTRLPKNHIEGDIPRIAVTTGWCDQLACLLPKLGLDANEFTPSDGPGRLHLYRGAADRGPRNTIPGSLPMPAPAPDGTHDATELWSSQQTLSRYDMVMLSCECGEHNETKPSSSKDAMYAYASAGGRIFSSHFHYTWAQQGPLASIAQWAPNKTEDVPGPFFVDTNFEKGRALAQWLTTVGASQVPGQIPINQARENVGGVNATAQGWVYRDANGGRHTKYLTSNAPVGTDPGGQCGKFVFADMHLYGGDEQPENAALPDNNFPSSCSKELTPEEKALAFLFFDLASCVQNDAFPPGPPK